LSSTDGDQVWTIFFFPWIFAIINWRLHDCNFPVLKVKDQHKVVP
jgi:hypothetical protein